MADRNLVAVDLFAGGGGASEGIRRASGVEPILAVNHCPHAVAMHERNHPGSIHLCESVHDVQPGHGCAGRLVDLLWASPDCTHFSRAKGGKPRKKEIRALAWVVVEWAREVAPRGLLVENVPEFVTWGPLDADGRVVRARKGETFRAWVQALEQLGYAVEWRVLVGADYGAPTTRKRLFIVARRDGRPIVWPEPTHGQDGQPQPWRTAAECIDWSIPCPSIFTRKRPLAEATQRRIAEGIRRYVLESPSPFIVNLTHGGRLEPLDEPFRTITAANRGEKALVAPYVVPSGYGEREGQRPRTRTHEPGAPLPTIVGANKHAVVAAFLAKHYGGPNGHPTPGQDLRAPMPSVTSRGQLGPVAVHLTKFYGSAKAGQPVDAPLGTITAGGGRGGGHMGLVAAFLLKYYGQGGQWSGLDEPMHTIVAKARMGLVTVDLDGEPHAIVDIGMRMLQPRELARAQGFSDDYVLTGTKSQQIARIGNSVCPPVVQALVEAQFGGPGCPQVGLVGPQLPIWGHRFDEPAAGVA